MLKNYHMLRNIYYNIIATLPLQFESTPFGHRNVRPKVEISLFL